MWRTPSQSPSHVAVAITLNALAKASSLKKYSDKHHIFAPTAGARYSISPQTFHGGRARRAHHKRCHPFFDLIHSFSASGQNIDIWLLSKNNTGRLPLCGILPVTRNKSVVPSRTCIPAGCCVTLPRRVLITMSIITMRISRKLCVRLFTFSQISTAILRILWRHLQTDLRIF